jgi:two-component system, NtrC family, nitrogen regulation sensor histidine kinase NtrY
MTFKDFDWNIWRRVFLLLVTLTMTAIFISKGLYVYTVIVLPLIIYQVLEFIRFQKTAFEELNLFVESVRYRDFSRRFDAEHATTELQTLRKGFNEINAAFKLISKEKETQYQYLQKILELVDTGILSYEQWFG